MESKSISKNQLLERESLSRFFLPLELHTTIFFSRCEIHNGIRCFIFP
jgi:hypothetical protein